MEQSDFLGWKASQLACGVLEMRVTFCLDGAETATPALSNVSVWKYHVSVKSRNTCDLWPVGIMYLKATRPGSVCSGKLSTVFSSAHHWIPRLGLNSATPCFHDASSVLGWRINRSVVSPHWKNLRLCLIDSPGGLMLMLESSIEGTELCRSLQGKDVGAASRCCFFSCCS